jgi:hypothetical protein
VAGLALPSVTLCAATSVNVPATIAALRRCLDQVAFGDCLLFTDAEGVEAPGMTIVPIPRMGSAKAYSDFMLRGLASHVRTTHCLVIQWDGFVLDAERWEPAFLDLDYIGAPWPQFGDGHDVGNGGFSLRSRKLLDACRDPDFRPGHPEDLAICRDNRALLETRHGIRFADTIIAERFAFERTSPATPTFGFHGVFNMVTALGADRFWALYLSLDDPRTVLVDYWLVMRQLGSGRHALRRRLRLTLDRLSGGWRR